MSLLVGQNLKKAYGPLVVLSGADLRVAAGEKLGIVGRNGGGKTTLLRLIEGEETPDEGELVIAKSARLGYVPQRPRFEPGQTARAYVESGLDEVQGALRELDRVNEALGEVEGDELDRLVREQGRLTERVEFLGGWDAERRVETVLSGIGLPEALWEREAQTLSGGEKSRTALARELVSRPDLLLLDEPTNHLDLAGIEWLEDYLRELQGAVVVVSHDRRLLDRSVDAILELGFGELTRYPGRYSVYLELKEERFRVAMRAWQQQQEEIRKEDSFIKKHMGSQRTAEAKGRLKRLRRVDRLERPHHDVRRPKIRPPKAERGGEMVLRTEGLSVGYPTNTVLENVEVRIGRGERVGIVGPNGQGKSTLLRVLAGRDRPLSGEVTSGHKAACGYFDQESGDLRDDLTPFKTIRLDHPTMEDEPIRDHLARFLFRGDDIDAEVSSLSGGERSRLVLARLVLEKPSWLALDEPTNHLDLAARTALEEMLGEFQGAIVCVSHDRAFLDGLCNAIIEVDAGRVTRYEGNYTAYREAVEGQREAARKAAEDAERARRKQEEKRRAEQEKKKRKGKKGGKGGSKDRAKPRNPYMLKKLEERIIALEEEKEGVQAEMATEDVYKNGELLREKQIRLAEIERDLDDLNSQWEELVG